LVAAHASVRDEMVMMNFGACGISASYFIHDKWELFLHGVGTGTYAAAADEFV